MRDDLLQPRHTHVQTDKLKSRRINRQKDNEADRQKDAQTITQRAES